MMKNVSKNQEYGSIPQSEPAVSDESHLHPHYDDRDETPRTRFRRAVRNVVNASLVFEGHLCSVHHLGGNATILSELANITKNLVGSGVLSLAGGIALYSDSPSAAPLASFWIILMGAIFGYFCLVIAKVCKMTRSVSYRECWEKTMGDHGAFAVSLVTALYPAMGNLAFSIILSQTFHSLLETVGIDISRGVVLVMITLTLILPLCLLKHLDILAPFSVLGITGTLLTAVAMVVRSLDGSYQPGGVYYNDIPSSLQPKFGDRNEAWSSRVLPFLCMIFNSYVMHYNVPRFYSELSNPSIPRFAAASGGSFGLSIVIFIFITMAGFLTFGGHCDSFILNNYSPHDSLATFCRVAIAFSSLTTYPLVFIGFRDGILDALEVPMRKQTSRNLEVLTFILLSIITAIALRVSDLGLVNTVGGGTFATAIVFVFPAFMYHRAVRGLGDAATTGQHRETVFCFVLMIFGIFLGLSGIWGALE